ncbi:MAG: preprotein translocase subunit SecY, partial [Rickettsiales bacterium]|nr:preprotein translocase subunit SecY [Rickettsiales bacterium]
SPELKELKKEGESGHEKINQYTRYLTILICCVQGWGISAWLENMTGPSGAAAVADPGFFFRFSTVVSLLGGTMLVMWMGEQITSRGIGNGSSLIIFAGIVANLPGAVFQTIELGKVGQLQPLVIAMILGVLVAATLFVVFMEQAQRRVLIHYPKQNMGAMANTTHLPLKINTAGVIPPIFAGAILQIPAAFIMFGASSESSLVMFFNRWLSDGSPVYYFVYSSLIVFFAFFYTALQFNSEETAENLKSYGAFISGVRPGAATAEYFDRVLTRITVLGSAYLVVLCMLPSFLINQFGVPFYLGGTTLLIVCNVVTETVAQIQANLISGQYQGIIKNAKSAGKPRFAR